MSFALLSAATGDAPVLALALFGYAFISNVAARYPLGKYLAAIAVGRLPRYLLLAWLGYAIRLPAWLLVLVFVLLLIPLIPTLRTLLWPRPDVK